MAPAPVAAQAPPAPVMGGQGLESATGMLALAQKLHDDFVRSGEEQRDQILGEAKERASRLVREAEEKHRQTLGSLEQERSLLERKIDELRIFERDYRKPHEVVPGVAAARPRDPQQRRVPERPPGSAGRPGRGLRLRWRC
ncbi:MAG: hypothetical protein PGN11_20325 [Quadrisphaera sp.]